MYLQKVACEQCGKLLEPTALSRHRAHANGHNRVFIQSPEQELSTQEPWYRDVSPAETEAGPNDWRSENYTVDTLMDIEVEFGPFPGAGICLHICLLTCSRSACKCQ
jgi:hypothetical protein